MLEALLDQIKALLADIAYSAKARLLDRLEQHQVEAVIPPKSNQKEPWEFDQDKYRWRHLIENFFVKLSKNGWLPPATISEPVLFWELFTG